MNNLKHSDDDLSTASAPLMIYCALIGVCALLMLVITITLWPPDKGSLILFFVLAIISIILGILSWGVRKEKKWAWIPAAGFATVFATAFPIGTIISYFALTALWRCRGSFFPFAAKQSEQNAAEQPATAPQSKSK